MGTSNLELPDANSSRQAKPTTTCIGSTQESVSPHSARALLRRFFFHFSASFRIFFDAFFRLPFAWSFGYVFCARLYADDFSHFRFSWNSFTFFFYHVSLETEWKEAEKCETKEEKIVEDSFAVTHTQAHRRLRVYFVCFMYSVREQV